ncbi:flavodoxin family protein [Lactiplantibacillus plantarum]|uniref:flavodoxin family protein n=1 Tax=Lactiplantibacillus plantarum TaxID=1590 RepID=UPI001CECC46E|nr:hypothetical protein [Lactiplantibacillus plantarum]MCZ2273725.1 hypothetical protein [Lactiplantibacillus plantarum]
MIKVNAQVVYFSNSGNNERLAKKIAAYYTITATPIVPVNAYPTSYDALTTQAKRERFRHVEVPIRPLELKLDTSTLILVSPIWYADLPRPVVTFLKQLQRSYQRVVFISDKFMVGFGTCGRTLRKYLPSTTIIDKVAASRGNLSPIMATLGK